MQAEVVPFPGAHAPGQAARPAPAGQVSHPRIQARREYTFAEVTRLLSLEGEPRTQISYLRDLARQCAMPLPRNPRRFKGRLQTGADVIGSRSRWCALEIDAWLDSQRTPPPGVPSASAGSRPQGGVGGASPRLPAPVRADMMERARKLASGGR